MAELKSLIRATDEQQDKTTGQESRDNPFTDELNVTMKLQRNGTRAAPVLHI